MDEYERMEKDLMKLHQVYLERLRNLEYLENELELYNRNEQEKHEESQKALRRLQRKMSNNNAVLNNMISMLTENRTMLRKKMKRRVIPFLQRVPAVLW